jgi:hypothetical protein
MTYSLVDKLYANRQFEEEVEILGLKVRFRVLSAAEEEQVGRAMKSENLLQMMQSRRIPTLARAIISIDGAALKDFDEIKQRLRDVPQPTLEEAIEQELRGPKYTEEVISDLYVAYSDFRGRYRQHLDSLKKSSQETSPAVAG